MKIAALAGGVGGAKMVSGIAELVRPDNFTVIVNTGDDFDWMGLQVCPDLDTIIYTLARLANPLTGWGIHNDSFHTLNRLKELGCDGWFLIGDRDLATHLFRSELKREGKSLTEIVRLLCRRNGVMVNVVPMCDSPVPTLVHTGDGTLEFQDYFVRRKCKPIVTGFSFSGAESVHPAPGLIQAIDGADAVILCPSNPFISIGPILAVPGIRHSLNSTRATVMAVSPIIRGESIKGPTAAMLSQMGMPVSAVSVAKMYRDFLDIFVVDESDENLIPGTLEYGIDARRAPILMNDQQARHNLARLLLEMLG
jgi:LPPG:FO 2-phospho-L-lactate transferase